MLFFICVSSILYTNNTYPTYVEASYRSLVRDEEMWAQLLPISTRKASRAVSLQEAFRASELLIHTHRHPCQT